MTLSVSAEPWFKPTAWLIGAAVGAALWAYVAGGIFMLAHGHKFEDARLLTLAQYWLYYGEDAGIRRWIYISVAGALALLLTPFVILLLPSKRSLFGDARFAKTREIKKAGLLLGVGLIVGRYKGQYLTFPGSQHVILSAPTRSGKGVGVVIPNLLSWRDSVVVLDMKKENHGLTSRFRQRNGQPCFLFDPGADNYRTHRWNPLWYVSEDRFKRIDDLQKIGAMFFPDIQGTDPIWTATPRSLFLGIALMLFETPYKVRTMGQVLRETLVDGDGARYFSNIILTREMGARGRSMARAEAKDAAEKDLRQVLYGECSRGAAMARKVHEMAIVAHVCPEYREALRAASSAALEEDASRPNIAAMVAAKSIDKRAAEVGTPLSATCVQSLNTYVTIASDNTRSGVMTSFRSRLELWNNPLIDAATAANDFDLRDVRRRRMSIYLGVTPDNLERMAPLLNLFFQQLIDLNTRKLPQQDESLKYQCLILADEFTAMGRVPCLSKGISYIAGYGLRLMPIIQSPAQVVDVYGKEAAQTFTTNHALQIVFPPKASETSTAKDICEWLGYQTVKGVSRSKGKALFSKRETSENESDQRRALLLPQELTSLGKEKQIVVVEDTPAIMGKRIRFYEDATFVDRLRSVSPSLAKARKWWRFPTQRELDTAVKLGELAAPVPRLDMSAHEQALVHESYLTHVDGSVPSHLSADASQDTEEASRPVDVSDLPNLGSLALSDFEVDFTPMARPLQGELSEAALIEYADILCRQAGIAA